VAVHGLHTGTHDGGRGLVVLRFGEPAAADVRARALAQLVAAGVTPPTDDRGDSGPVELVAVPWIVAPDREALARHREALAGVATVGVMEVRCVGSDPGDDARVPACPIEGFPEILQTWARDAFGIAVKLDGTALTGEESVMQAFHALWLAPYRAADVDEEDEPADDATESPGYRGAAVEIDAEHRAAHLWVDRLEPTVGAEEAVKRLLWIVARLGEIVPIAHARFGPADPSRVGDDGATFVLAGNPLRTRVLADGEAAAVAWAESQRTWSPRELAAMMAELVTEVDPTRAAAAALALRWCDRGLALDPSHSDLPGYRLQLLVEQGRVGEAIEHARPAPVMLAHLVGLVGERAPEHFATVLAALDPTTVAAIAAASPELVEPLVLEVAAQAPTGLPALLAALPRDAALGDPLRAAAEQLEAPLSAHVLAVVRELPLGADDEAS
jgi:hypothetical protein